MTVETPACEHVVLRCRECGWEGAPRNAALHAALTRHVPAQVVVPACASSMCSSVSVPGGRFD